MNIYTWWWSTSGFGCLLKLHAQVLFYASGQTLTGLDTQNADMLSLRQETISVILNPTRLQTLNIHNNKKFVELRDITQ